MYTDEEKNLLLDSLSFNIGNPEEEPEIELKYNNCFYYIIFSDMYILVYEEPLTSLSSINQNIAKEIANIIHKEPLENMPLFINTLLEIATWRLRIGK
jgi:hypothetical protein